MKFKNLLTKIAFQWILPALIGITISFLLSSNYKLIVAKNAYRLGDIQNNDLLIISKNQKISRNSYILAKNKSETILQKCIGLPGDSIKLTDNQLIINNLDIETDLFNQYRIDFNPNAKNNNLLTLLFQLTTETQALGWFNYPLNKASKEKILKSDLTYNIRAQNDSKNLIPYSFYFTKDFVSWSQNNYGLYVIPKKGMRINSSLKNWHFYGKLIQKYENKDILFDNNSFLANGKKNDFYEFRYDYYFLINPILESISDSRMYGPIPEKALFGSVYMLLFSFNNNKISFQRFLKKIN